MKGMCRNDTYLNGDGAVEARGADNSEDTGSNPVLRISHYQVHSLVLTNIPRSAAEARRKTPSSTF